MAHDILKLLDDLEPGVRDAFIASVNALKSEIQLSIVVAALERGDIEGALTALHLRPEFFADLNEAMRAAYIKGGADALAGLPRLPDPFLRAAWLRGLMFVTRELNGS